MLDLADPPLVGTGEGVRLVAEYLAVEQVLRQAAAVQRDEGMLVAPAIVMEATRHQLLAGAGLAEDQHVGRGVADVGDQLAQRLDRRRAADDPLRQVLAAGQLATQRADLAGQPALLQGAAGDLDQAFRREGLLHEVVGAGVHRLYRHGDVAVTGDQHHRQARVEDLRRSSRVRPSMPGRRMSLTTMPAKSRSTRCSASSALPTPMRGCPPAPAPAGSRARHADRLRRSGRKAARSSGGTRSRGIGNQGQAQLEGGSAAFGVLHAEAAAGGGGQAGREGQAEAQAMFAGLGGEEGFEQVDARRRRIPGPLSRTRRT